jgi:hypothetical protein
VRAIPALPLAREPTKRKGFFSFHFDDLMRVNNVRNAWKIAHPNKSFMRNFYDRSLWESKKRESDDALKALICQGMQHASTLCVLVGSKTWERRWVKYEIARSVVDKKGLLAVQINGLNHHQRRRPDNLGFNPLHLIGIYRSVDAKFYLYKKRYSQAHGNFVWLPYRDYTYPVPLPRYLVVAPVPGYVKTLSEGAEEYDYVAQQGHMKLGTWIDRAAIRAGR